MKRARDGLQATTATAELVVVVGSAEHDEFRTLVHWWRTVANVFCLARLEELQAASQTLEAPALVILLQSRPGEFSHTRLQTILGGWPLTRVVNVYGSWCESEARSGLPPPSVLRLSWTHATARLVEEWQRYVEGACPAWSWGWTTTDDDRAASIDVWPMRLEGVRAIVSSASNDMIEALSDMLRSWGVTTDAVRAVDGTEPADVDVIVWDDMAPPRGGRLSCQPLRERYPSAPLIALVDFPRPQDLPRPHEGGVPGQGGRVCVLAKPCRAEVLQAALCQLAAGGRVVRPARAS